MAKKKRVITGIDVGTTKICSIIAQIEENEIQILGTGWCPSKGLRKGIVVNLSETIESVRRSLEEAEQKAQRVCESAFVSIGGAHLKGINCSGQTEVRSKNGEISTEDVARVVAEARSLDLPEDYEVIHVLTQTFTVDTQEGIVNPLGMTGKRLSVHLHLVINASPIVQNIINAINKAGVVVSGVVMQQLASAEAMLSNDEKELGSIVVDIGGGTTDIAIYSQGCIWHSEVLPMGGSLVTKDIAIGLKAPLQEAEELKRTLATVFPESVPEEEVVEVGEVGTGRRRTISRRLLCQIVQARCDEILSALREVIRKVGVRADLVTGVVLTGGGSLLDGLAERAEQLIQMPVRIGYPINVASKNDPFFHPAYCTSLGLLRYAREIQGEEVARATRQAVQGRSRDTKERMKNWLLEKIG